MKQISTFELREEHLIIQVLKSIDTAMGKGASHIKVPVSSGDISLIGATLGELNRLGEHYGWKVTANFLEGESSLRITLT